MTGTSHNSGYFPGGNGLVNATGDLVTLGTGLSIANNVLTGTGGGTVGSAVRRRGYSLSTPNGGPVITTPYYLIPYACLPGTINGAYVMMQAADGANYYYTVQIVPAGSSTATNVTGLTNNYASDGEGGASNAASYPAPLHATATGNNTYNVGDCVRVMFSVVGGTFVSTSFVLDVTE